MRGRIFSFGSPKHWPLADRIQGYHIAWPMQAGELLTWLAAYGQPDDTTRRLRRSMPRPRRHDADSAVVSL